MRIIIAECVARYSGRGDTYLPSGVRTILVKDDGCLSIHGDTGNKPLNYMPSKAKIEFIRSVNPLSGLELLTIVSETSTELLTITCTNVIDDREVGLVSPEPGLLRDNTEPHLQEWLVNNLELIDSSLIGPEREFETGCGPVDIIAWRDKTLVAIEVKRVATTPAIRQVLRYVESLREGGHDSVEGLVIAVKVMPKARKLAEQKGVSFVALNDVFPLGSKMEFSDNIGKELSEDSEFSEISSSQNIFTDENDASASASKKQSIKVNS